MEQKKILYSLDVVYELTTEGENIICYYADDLALAYRIHYLQKVRGKDVISNVAANNPTIVIIFLLESVLEKLVQVCSSVAGVVYKFSNRKIVSFHDNFKFMGNLPLTVYFDFETTTGDSVINDTKLFLSAIDKYLCSTHC